MITNFLLDHSELVPVALLVVAVLCAGLGWWALGFSRHQKLLTALAVLSAAPVVLLTFVPTGITKTSDTDACVVQFSLPSFGSVELLANVALIFPLVYFAGLATRRPVAVALAGSALSAVIEAVQALVPAIGRACDTNDWAMNTLGALIACLLALTTLALDRKRGGTRPSRSGHQLPR